MPPAARRPMMIVHPTTGSVRFDAEEETMKESISRRGFLKGALATGAVAAAGAALTGCAPSASPAAASGENGSTTSGARWSWETKPEPIPADKITKTYDCDICIIGAGATGVPAAYAAAKDGGAKTIVLQKGSGVVTNGWGAAAYNSRRFTEQGTTYDLTSIYARFAELANDRGDGRVVKLFLERSGEVMDYLIDETPECTAVCYPDETGHTFGWYKDNDFSTRYAGFKELLDTMVGKAEAAGAEFLWDTPAVQLVQDESGAVVGVVGETKKGEYVQVNASKGVVMACGDLSDDEEMVECYAPIIKGVPNMHGTPNNTGDGYKMGMWAGATLDRSPHCIMMHWDPTCLPEGYAPYSGNPWLRVNINGERYGNENLGYQSVVTACSEQPGQTVFQIVDSHWIDHCNDYKHDNSHSRFTTQPEHDWDDAVERGAIVKADTIEGLADAYGIDKGALVATVARYNELVDKGEDEDFGVRSDYLVWNGIKEPPFYAIKRVPVVLVTLGGLTVNDKLEVLDENAKPIPGFYAAGDCEGSFYGYDYPLFITGGSLGKAFTFGVLAAKSALGTLEEPIVSENAAK